jgi:hypothetical protein
MNPFQGMKPVPGVGSSEEEGTWSRVRYKDQSASGRRCFFVKVLYLEF